MKKPTLKTTSGSGFSLVELLVVIAVIAIIAAIAIPNIANVTGAARESSYQRNAQNLASVAQAARAAGYTNNWPTDVAALIGVLNTGVTVTPPNGQTMTFKVDAMNATDAANIGNYLSIDAVNVVYNPSGTGGNGTGGNGTGGNGTGD
jgi:type IV pilus assembly protein PilA